MKNKISLSLLSVIVIILIGGGLRSPITAVSPVLSEIIALLHLDNLQGSLLTSIPLIVFASCSVLVSKVAVKANIHYSIIYSLIFLIMGLYFRVYGNVPMLYIGSFLIGLGICIGNVTTPAYIKNRFPEKIGIMTGVFSAAMNLMAAFASGFSIAIGKWTNLGWKGSLGIWIIWTLLALFAVGAEAFSGKRASVKKPAAQTAKSEFNIFRSKQAWNISVFMGIQSLVYYCLVALLPIVLVDYGMQKEETGLVLLVAQLSMLPVMFLSPVIATKMKDQKWMIFGVGILMFSGISLLALFKTQYVYLAAVLVGIASGWAFSLSILFFSLKSKTMAGTIKSFRKSTIGRLFNCSFRPASFWNVTRLGYVLEKFVLLLDADDCYHGLFWKKRCKTEIC